LRKAGVYRQPKPNGEKDTAGLNVDIGSKVMVDVVTYLNSLEIKRLSDRHVFEHSNSTKLSKVEITRAESKKKANKNMDDAMATRLR